MTTKERWKTASLTTCLIFFGFTAVASADDVPSWATEQMLAPWYDAYNSQDAERLVDLYTSDARVGAASGRNEIIARFESGWADVNISCSGAYDGFQIVENLATGWGRDTCTETPKSGGESKVVHSRWLAVYERQSDGSWLCSRDIGEVTE